MGRTHKWVFCRYPSGVADVNTDIESLALMDFKKSVNAHLVFPYSSKLVASSCRNKSFLNHKVEVLASTMV